VAGRPLNVFARIVEPADRGNSLITQVRAAGAVLRELVRMPAPIQ
jgi:hypothetical protein